MVTIKTYDEAALNDTEKDSLLNGEDFDDNIEETLERVVPANDAGARIDAWLAQGFEELSRSYVQKLISDGLVKVNGSEIKANYKLRENDRVLVQIPFTEELTIEPENILLDILYEDGDVIVVNKPQGMVVHPAPGNYRGTLVNALLWHCKDLSGINGIMRPGIVHRLDKDTSGVIMAAKNDMAHGSLAQQIKDRTVLRKYMALVQGVVSEPAGVVDAPIGRDSRDRKKMAVTTKNAKSAITRYTVIDRFQQYTLLECKLETGRTHQIRVHMKYINHPVVGDSVYAGSDREFELKGQLLHAFLLGFQHPRTGERMEFQAPLPEYFTQALNKLKAYGE